MEHSDIHGGALLHKSWGNRLRKQTVDDNHLPRKCSPKKKRKAWQRMRSLRHVDFDSTKGFPGEGPCRCKTVAPVTVENDGRKECAAGSYCPFEGHYHREPLTAAARRMREKNMREGAAKKKTPEKKKARLVECEYVTAAACKNTTCHFHFGDAALHACPDDDQDHKIADDDVKHDDAAFVKPKATPVRGDQGNLRMQQAMDDAAGLGLDDIMPVPPQRRPMQPQQPPPPPQQPIVRPPPIAPLLPAQQAPQPVLPPPAAPIQPAPPVALAAAAPPPVVAPVLRAEGEEDYEDIRGLRDVRDIERGLLFVTLPCVESLGLEEQFSQFDVAEQEGAFPSYVRGVGHTRTVRPRRGCWERKWRWRRFTLLCFQFHLWWWCRVTPFTGVVHLLAAYYRHVVAGRYYRAVVNRAMSDLKLNKYTVIRGDSQLNPNFQSAVKHYMSQFKHLDRDQVVWNNTMIRIINLFVARESMLAAAGNPFRTTLILNRPEGRTVEARQCAPYTASFLSDATYRRSLFIMKLSLFLLGINTLLTAKFASHQEMTETMTKLVELRYIEPYSVPVFHTTVLFMATTTITFAWHLGGLLPLVGPWMQTEVCETVLQLISLAILPSFEASLAYTRRHFRSILEP